VEACRDRIRAGDLLQANVCGELEGRVAGSPLELFIRGVTALAPDRAAFLQGPWGAIVSLSPELFLERHGRRVRTAPIKGTRRRPAAPEKAIEERAVLERSEKDRAENVMIVDLMRNDLGRVCEYGTIAVESLAQARGHTGVWHLVSEVGGLLRVGVDDGQLLGAAFPPGSVTGAPKIAAMNVSSELESVARQAYTGAIGIVSPQAGLELNVAIRTFEINGSTIRLGVGGGVVADSDPQAEATELAVKAAPLLDALESAAPRPSASRRVPLVRRRGPVPVPRPDARCGVFETVRLQDGHALRVESHLARLRASIATLYGAHLSDSIGDEIAVAARRIAGPGRLRIDVVPDNGGLRVGVNPGPSRASESVRLRVQTVPGGLGCHKWVDRRLTAAMEADSRTELPLLVDADGRVLETSRANVFALGRDGVLRTPPDDGRILPGVARADVLSPTSYGSFEVIEAPLFIEDLISARGVILTNALGTATVLAIDDYPLCVERRLAATIQGAVKGCSNTRMAAGKRA
jgi:para-aminobenzoate synthetase/4-amino-4-deoxychorismate lyase